MSLTCDFGWGLQAEPSGPPECCFLLGLLDSLRAERDLVYKNYILCSRELLLFLLLKGHTGLLRLQGEVGAKSLFFSFLASPHILWNLSFPD